jgi:hypothetical protein
MTLAVAVLCLLSITGCKKDSHKQIKSPDPVQSSPSPASSATTQQQKECLAAAQKALGVQAQVVRCGELNTPGIQEVIAVLPYKLLPSKADSIPIRKMAILRKEPSGWHTSLTAAREVQNEAGYVGLDYIDDDFHYFGYWLTISNEHLDNATELLIDLLDIENADGSSEAASTEFAWNPAVGRYQEWAYDQNPEGFKPEFKNPPHFKGGVMIPPRPPQ